MARKSDTLTGAAPPAELEGEAAAEAAVAAVVVAVVVVVVVEVVVVLVGGWVEAQVAVEEASGASAVRICGQGFRVQCSRRDLRLDSLVQVNNHITL